MCPGVPHPSQWYRMAHLPKRHLSKPQWRVPQQYILVVELRVVHHTWQWGSVSFMSHGTWQSRRAGVLVAAAVPVAARTALSVKLFACSTSCPYVRHQYGSVAYQLALPYPIFQVFLSSPKSPYLKDEPFCVRLDVVEGESFSPIYVQVRT